MAAGSNVAAPERTLVVTRVFDAPRELVYQAWTDPKLMAQWFPPKDFTAPVCELDPRPGGVFRIDMKGPDGPPFNGEVMPGKGVFREVVPNERLVFTFAGEGDVPPPLLVTVLFEAQGNRTRLTIHQTAETVADYEALIELGAAEGLRESFEKLDELLARGAGGSTVSVTDRVLTLSRVFDAPRELVWTAYTDPKHIVKWMFAKDWESPFAETDVRPGGAFRIGMGPADHSHEGFVFDGTYREITRNERIVQAISDGRVMTATFEDVAGKTRLTLTVEMAMSEEQERQGYTEILENFARHLATLAG
ncbi:MAG TPA: SRPBCC domain-containing protein, partial [Candidatus Limnocylindria bacterium]|nr:SRPBCC domain-containing protein [Candidatus Limnocylindria bacterium]